MNRLIALVTVAILAFMMPAESHLPSANVSGRSAHIPIALGLDDAHGPQCFRLLSPP
jgi:hypothetical protein